MMGHAVWEPVGTPPGRSVEVDQAASELGASEVDLSVLEPGIREADQAVLEPGAAEVDAAAREPCAGEITIGFDWIAVVPAP